MSAIAVASLTGIELAADSALKSAAKPSGDLAWLVVGITGYAALGWVIYTSDKTGAQWGIVNSYWNAVNNIVTPLAMMYLFNESYTGMQWCGMVVIAAGILLLGSA